MVCNDVNHHPDAFGVSCSDKGLKFVRGSEVGVNAFPVFSPVSMVATGQVVDNWTDPDGIEAHSFDVVQAVLNTFEGATAVV